MFSVVVTKATMSTSCYISPLSGKREKWLVGVGVGRWEESILLCQPASVYELDSCDKPWLFQFF